MGVHLPMGGLHCNKWHMQAANLYYLFTCLLYSCSWESLNDIWIGVFLAKSWSKALSIHCQGGDVQPRQKLASE